MPSQKLPTFHVEVVVDEKHSHLGVVIEIADCTHHTDSVFNGAFGACFQHFKRCPN